MATWNNPDTGVDYKYGNNWGDALGGSSSIASGIAGLFGGNNSSKGMQDAGNQYLNQIPGQTGQYFDPYFNAGKSQLPGLQDQYNQLLTDPGKKYNQMGESFQQSPGFKFALEQALGAANRSAAAGGMAGTPMNTQQDMQLANDMALQDYYNYMQGATGLFGQGLTGSQGLANMGLNAGTQQANMIAQQLAQQAANAREDKAAENKSKGSSWGNILGGAAKVASAFI
jgi:hypothetical protein